MKPAPIATLPAATARGLRGVFADIDDTMTMDPDHVDSLVGPRTRFLLPVHFSGHVADLDRLGRTAKKNGLTVIEDAAQAHGAPDPPPGVGGLQRQGLVDELGPRARVAREAQLP